MFYMRCLECRAQTAVIDSRENANKHGRPFVAEKVVARHLGPLLAKAKIPHGGFHAFRHAHSSLLIDGGASVKVEQAQLPART